MWKATTYDTTRVTVELGTLIENGFTLFDFAYPKFEGRSADGRIIIDPADLEQKIIDHYYFRQIGQETPARFKRMFASKMREIMPYYNQLYWSVLLLADQGDPFEAYNLTETYQEQRQGEGSQTGTTTTQSTRSTQTEGSTSQSTTGGRDADVRRLDTPMGRVTTLDDGYLTQAEKQSETTTSTTEGTTNTTEDATESDTGSTLTQSTDSNTTTYTMTRKGNIGVQPLGAEVEALRKAFINVDNMIIDELNELFLCVY